MIIKECITALRYILDDVQDTELTIENKIEYAEHILKILFVEYEKHIFKDFVKQMIHEIIQDDSNPYKMDWVCSPSYIDDMLKIEQPEQRSPEWFAFRSERLTASDIATALGENNYCKPEELILKKCGISKPFTMNPACQHGVKYEPVSCMVYEFYNETTVHEFGCISHKYYNFIGASPDGITNDGTMLEIKNPFSRKITGLPPKSYWIQMQIQMEVFDLQRCDFLECKMTEYFDYEEYEQDDSVGFERKGVLVEYCTSDNYNEPKYEYCPVEREDKLVWVQEAQKRFDELPNGMYDLKVIWWKMQTYSCIRIYRDTEWFSKALPQLASFWDTIIQYRRSGEFVNLIHVPKKRKSVCKLLPTSAESAEESKTKSVGKCLFLP